jgi:hypothetical protein
MAASETEENYWPGYVDALTTMTMVLTFIMLVLGLAVFSLSQNVSKSMLESIAGAMKLTGDMPKDMSSDDITRMVIELVEKQEGAGRSARVETESKARADALRLASARPDEVRQPPSGRAVEPGDPGSAVVERRIESTAAAPIAQAIPVTTVSKQQAQLRLVYKPRATGLDDAAREAIGQALAADSALQAAKTVEIIAGVDSGNLAVSDANRIAYYRALILRGQLMAAGIIADRIKVRVDPAVAADQMMISAIP